MNELPWYLSFIATVTCGRPFSCCISSFILMFWWRTVSCKHRSSFCCWSANWTACRSPSLTLLVYSPVKQKTFHLMTEWQPDAEIWPFHSLKIWHPPCSWYGCYVWINYGEYYPCSVCRKGVVHNPIMSMECLNWVHKRFSRISTCYFHSNHPSVLSKNVNDAEKCRSQINE